jgi:hypothetical protein
MQALRARPCSQRDLRLVRAETMSKRDWKNLGYHIGVALVLAALVLWNHWFMVLATFIYAWLREQGQHRYDLRRANADSEFLPYYHVEKSTFFGWMTWHRMFEVLQWTFGAALASLGWQLFG